MEGRRKRFQHVTVEQHISFSPHTSIALDQFLDNWYKVPCHLRLGVFIRGVHQLVLGCLWSTRIFLPLSDEHQLLL
jgi:hypothetical protein